MVKKQVLVIDGDGGEDFPATEALLDQNAELQHILTCYKNKISEHYKNKLWDRYKKLTNEYEMIFTTPNTGSNISRYLPVSRSFFKMWEMLHDFSEDAFGFSIGVPINAMFLAEGPGGFAEALVKFREGHSADRFFGISLRSVNKNIPDWKYQHKVQICYGSDGTGDLYKKTNLDHLAQTHPKMEVITADGGFDFSNDFNAQEESSVRLILCEIYAALLLQKQGGCLVLKIYDMFHEHTLKIVAVIKRFYEKIHVVKPLTSRPANSEKYLVCSGFDGERKGSFVERIGALIACYDDAKAKSFFDGIDHDPRVVHHIVCYNAYYTLRQAYYIERTIRYIEEFAKNYHDATVREKMKSILDSNRVKSIKWCEKYGLEHV